MHAVSSTCLMWSGIALAGAAASYALVAWVALRMRRRPSRAAAARSPPVTILKPLCGAEPELYACLRSFCVQQYPEFQLVFGVRDALDPALDVVRRLQREFPGRLLQIAIDPRQHGSNRKVSNLINMLPLARFDHLVIADSDVRVSTDYLARVVAPLLDPGVGIVTCAYRGWPRPGFWSLLGSLFINEWFLPSVRVAALAGSRAFAFGATIAVRRETLGLIGGFAAIAHHLADDYRLGELTRIHGLRTVLSGVVVETSVDERSLTGLVRHQLRWLRTIRAVRPIGYSLSFVTFSVPVAGIGVLLAAGAWPTLVLFGVAASARFLQHRACRTAGSPTTQVLALPLSDLLGLTLWCWGFAARRVEWRNDRFQIALDGRARSIGEPASSASG